MVQTKTKTNGADEGFKQECWKGDCNRIC